MKRALAILGMAVLLGSGLLLTPKDANAWSWWPGDWFDGPGWGGYPGYGWPGYGYYPGYAYPAYGYGYPGYYPGYAYPAYGYGWPGYYPGYAYPAYGDSGSTAATSNSTK
ncbi:hypothetical protein Mmc1_3706 [Magnetococcus marinus MC-1]|uniref:Sulfur globule protein CV3 n=1 Tax=Magnetococcus marinus (strain ATCC BAA-1437 / JCM 17883 / MC-1) TaxID=156889 RepID=A0LDZ8_MAGMM|nr:hypothetical protein [Magnetococcus marinus]ABK46191.1 hypothetical protein Mmc1_3706 [Magnetococcus marinus MC-1]